MQALAKAEAEETSRRKEVKDHLTSMAETIASLAEVVKGRQEHRDVLVAFDLVSTAQGQMVRETRTDTGEVLQMRQPMKSELQPGLGFD